MSFWNNSFLNYAFYFRIDWYRKVVKIVYLQKTELVGSVFTSLAISFTSIGSSTYLSIYRDLFQEIGSHHGGAAAAAAKSLQSCPTLWDPIDGSPPGSSVPGILQARTLEWAAISFSHCGAGKSKICRTDQQAGISDRSWCFSLGTEFPQETLNLLVVC